MDLHSIIFDYNKRQAMRNHPVFIQMRSLWENGLYDTSQKIGCLNYLIKQIHETKTEKNPNAVVKQLEWIEYYFESGRKRLSLDDKDSYQSKQYYGRTIEELFEIAKNFKEEATKNGFNINDQAALNFVYIKIIDDTYNEYMRCFNIIFKLKKLYPEFTFSLTKPLESIEYGVDIMIQKDNKYILALRALPRSAIKKQAEVEELHEQKHETFKMIYDINIVFIYSSVQGYIVKPSLEELNLRNL